MHDIATRSPYTGLSTFFIDEHADEIALLTGRLSLTPLQAVFISLFYRWRHAPVDLCKLYDHTCTYYLRWNDSHFDAVDTLVALGYLDLTVIDRRDHYRLNPDALKSILRGEPYRSVSESGKIVDDEPSLARDAKPEQSEVILDRIFPVEFSENIGQFNDGLTVVGLSCQKTELTRCVGNMNIERNEKLARFQQLPHPHVNDAVVSDKPPQGHVQTFQRRRLEIAGQTPLALPEMLVGRRKLAVEGCGKTPRGKPVCPDMLRGGKRFQTAVTFVNLVKTP